MSTTRTKPRIYFTKVLALPDGAVVLGGHMQAEEEDPTFTRLALLNRGAWGVLGDMPDVVYGLATKPNPQAARPTLVAMGRLGLIRTFVAGGKPVDQKIPWRDVTYLECLRLIDGELYCCGGQRQVVREESNGWKFVDTSLYEPFSGKLASSLLSIDGRSRDRIVAVGLKGQAWLWDGKQWILLDTPTNMTLNSVMGVDGGGFYVCGDGGTLFYLDATLSWVDLSDPEVSGRSFWDLAMFQGEIYVAAENQLLRTDGASLENVPLGLASDPLLFALSASENRLWCVGDERVYEFDGKSCAVHICPDNR